MKAWIVTFAVIVAGVAASDSPAADKTRVGQLVEYNIYETANGPLDTLATLCTNLRDSLQAVSAKLSVAQDSLESVLTMLDGHFRGKQLIYPDLGQGTKVDGGAGTYEPGNTAVIIPTDSIDTQFTLCCIMIHDASAADDYQIDLYCAELGADSLIGQYVAERGNASGTISPFPIVSPVLPKNTKVSGRLASSSGGDYAYIKLGYHLH